MSAAILRHLRRRLSVASPDAELLHRYLDRRDEDAFHALVERHGPAVLGECRRRLRDPHAADDAFQATFLVLARHAKSVRRPEALAAWLYGVARRVCARARAARVRRAEAESQAAPLRPIADPADSVSARELLDVLDTELDRLPERYRVPLWLVYWQGVTHAEAGRQLGLSAGALHGRLERGRRRLADALRRRGFGPDGHERALLLVATGIVAVPGDLLARTLAVAVTPTSTAVPAAVVALATAAVPSKVLPAAALAVLLASAGAIGLLASREGERLETGEPQPPVAHAPGSSNQPRVDHFGDPLPEGAIARLGTIRFRPGRSVSQLAFSPDGKRLAAWAVTIADAALFIYDVDTGREMRCIELPDSRLAALAWLPDGRGLAVVELGDESHFVWEFTDEKSARPPTIPRARFGRVFAGEDRESFGQFAISPDGRHLAAGRLGLQPRQRLIDLLELQTGKRVEEIRGVATFGPQPGDCTGLAFAADGQSLVAVSRERKAKTDSLVVYDVASRDGRPALTVPAALQQGRQMSFTVSPDGRKAVLGLVDGTARLWDLEAGAERRSLGKHVGERVNDKGVSAVAFSPDGRTLVTAGGDGSVRGWDAQTGQERRAFGKDLSWPQTIAWTRDGRLIAAAGQGGSIHIWDSATGADAREKASSPPIWEAVMTPNGRTAATWCLDHTLRLWDAETGREQLRVELPKGKAGGLLLAPDGRTLLLTVAGRKTSYDLVAKRMTTPPAQLAEADGRLLGFAADGRTLLTADKDSVTLWDWPTGRARQKIRLPADSNPKVEMRCDHAVLAPGGRTVAISRSRMWTSKIGDFIQTNGETLPTEFWDASTGERRRQLEVRARHTLFTADGQTVIVSGSANIGIDGGTDELAGALAECDVSTGKLRKTFAYRGPAKPIDHRYLLAMTLSPDGRTLATAENDATVLLYDIATGQVRGRLAGHRDDVTALAFSADGRRLLTFSIDRTALIWDLQQWPDGGPGPRP